MRPLIAILIMLGFLQCSDPQGAPVIVYDLEGDMSIELRERLDEHDSRLDLVFYSHQQTYCEDADIQMEFRHLGSELSLHISGVSEDVGCSPKVHHAQATLALDSLPPGRYPLQISIGSSLLNEGALDMQEDGYRIEIQKNRGLILHEPHLYKLNCYIIWGLIDQSDDPAASFTELVNRIGMEVYFGLLESGNYSDFKIDTEGHLLPKDSTLRGASWYFLYTGEKSRLLDALHDTRANRPEEIFSVFDAAGRSL